MRITRGRGFARAATLAAVALATGALAACGSDDDTSTSGGTGTAAASTAATGDGDVKKIAFFGFAGANSFAQATWAGVQEAAKAAGVEAEFFDPNFDSAKQVSQIQNAIASGDFDAFVVQANDGNAVVPVVEEAIAEGIPVVAEFTPVGTDYASLEPQVEGMVFVGEPPVENGTALGEMAVEACGDLDPCKIAYLEGNPQLPLDAARTEAVKEAISKAPNAELVATVVGGYTQADGLKAGQNVLQAHPDVNVIVGSSQAIAGVEQAVEDAGKAGEVKLIGNGGSRQAVKAVKDGRWAGVYVIAEKAAGRKAAELAIAAAKGEDVPSSFDTRELQEPRGTKETLGDFEGEYDD
ncbi:MAG: sugar ABC transporter substrate-binding protein [Solirubrobacteraceae bacterium]|nr:sugar ABC transporter substrate-binding protein [Solirubrobacteraceae bacterium]